MKRVVFNNIPLEPARFAGMSGTVHRVCFVLFLVQLLVAGLALGGVFPRLAEARWPDGLLLVLATATTIAALARHLPGQNVMLASVVIAIVGSGVHTLGALTGVPFGPFEYTPNFGQKLFEPLAWPVPFLWLVMTLNARGVARLALRPWRRTRNYGVWLILASVVLCVVFVLALEPFGTQARQYWLWRETKLPLSWYGAPLTDFLGWAMTAALILAFVTPALIIKKPVKLAPDFFPLYTWTGLNLLLAAGAIKAALWPAAIVTVVFTLVTAALAIYGGRDLGPSA